ncbi:MAG: hypothetical protein ACI4OW_06550 [Alphaproteobacteria bacterium]
MEKADITFETLRIQHAQLDPLTREEENHVWKKLIRIEELKRENLRKKDTLLRQALRI